MKNGNGILSTADTEPIRYIGHLVLEGITGCDLVDIRFGQEAHAGASRPFGSYIVKVDPPPRPFVLSPLVAAVVVVRGGVRRGVEGVCRRLRAANRT